MNGDCCSLCSIDLIIKVKIKSWFDCFIMIKSFVLAHPMQNKLIFVADDANLTITTLKHQYSGRQLSKFDSLLTAGGVWG